MKFKVELLKEDLKHVLPVIIAVIFTLVIGNIVLEKICLTRILFGIPCPGCGITRAFLLVLQGKFYEATVMHPLWIPLLLLAIAFLINRYFIDNMNVYKKILKFLKMIGIIIVVFSIVFYTYRMITYFPKVSPMKYDKDNLLRIIIKFFTNILAKSS